MTCEKDAGNRRKDPFSDEFEIFHVEHQVCARRQTSCPI